MEYEFDVDKYLIRLLYLMVHEGSTWHRMFCAILYHLDVILFQLSDEAIRAMLACWTSTGREMMSRAKSNAKKKEVWGAMSDMIFDNIGVR